MSNDPQYDPYANGQQGPDVTQTWEGQTWDTQFQPVVQQQPPVTYEAPYQDPYAQPAYEPSYDNTAYSPPQGAVAYEQHQHQQQPYAAAPAAPVGYDTPVPAYVPEPMAEAAHAAPAAGYSSPTTSGNTRITDAQRARAEGRSPVIEPGLQPAALTAVLGLLLAGGAAVGPYGLLVPLVLLQGLTAAGWFRLNGMWPARQGIALAFAGGLVADAALLATGREHAAAAILGTLGAWVLLCLVLQLRSHADPDERMYGLMAGVASAALTVVAAGHLGAAPDAVVVGGIAVAATVVARALPLPGPVSLIVALLAGAGAGIAAGGLNDLGGSGALIGLAAGVCALVGLRVASYDYPSRFVHMTAGVALPLTAAAPAVYLLGRALA
ncbi:hypothetical protein ASC82_24610 [Streptomyces sp. Root431]|uniref:hypothetical protein n=1 Tax=Streptomyces sp. Root431 TaxID=1736535 RepID=UPI000701D112|nr:hypothetical protein [Streptomyces sp. Root431]KQX10822.1 hypothetical protein ASC82_24610 [Streptomyces sp. Root431]